MKRILFVFIFCSVLCGIVGCSKQNKSNPVISDEDAYYVTVTDNENNYGISNKAMYESLKKYYGVSILCNMVDVDLLTNVNGVNYISDISQSEIEQRLIKTIFGSEELMNEMGIAEQAKARQEHYKAQVNNGLHSEDEVFLSVKLTLAKEKYVKASFEIEEITETYINEKIADLRRSKGLVIFDSVIETGYIADFDAKLKKAKKSSTSVVAKVNKIEYTSDQLFAKMQQMFGTNVAIEKLQIEMILRDTNLNQTYDYANYDNAEERILDASKWENINSIFNLQKSTFDKDGFEGYSKSMGWDTFMKEYFNVDSEDELRFRILYSVLIDELAAKLGSVTDDTAIDSALWQFYYNAMAKRVKDYYGVTGFHLLISVYEDGNNNGVYDSNNEADSLMDPTKWTTNQKTLVEELYDEVITILEAADPLDYQALVINFERDFKSGGISSGAYAEYKNAGITLMYQSLGSFGSGKMVTEFDEAARYIWQRKYDFAALGFAMEKEIKLYTKADALDQDYLVSQFGYHVYINTGWTPPTRYYAEKGVNGITLPSSEKLLEIIKKHTINPNDSALTPEDKSIITKFYIPIATEFKSQDQNTGGRYKYVEIFQKQIAMNIEFATDNEVKSSRYFNKLEKYRNTYIGSLSYLLPVLEITNKTDMTVAQTLELQLNINSAFAFSLETIKWSSSDETVATVNQNGEITAISKGRAVISATSEIAPKISSSVVIRVTD